MSPAYPNALPITDLQNIITTIQTKAVVSNKKAFAKSVWIVVGYGLNETLGDTGTTPAPGPGPNPALPDNVHILSATPALGSSGQDLTDDEVCDLLRPLAFQSGIGTDIAIAVIKQIPWEQVIAWAVKTIPTLFASGK